MRIIVSVILLAFITVSCGTNKRVYAPPFEEEETETVVVKENVQTTAQNPTKKKLKIQNLSFLGKRM